MVQRRTQRDGPPSPGPRLPAWKAFVVQFTAESDPDAGVLAGRVEHISSGERARFGSDAELLDCLRHLLCQANR
jgi:hypothetical protein